MQRLFAWGGGVLFVASLACFAYAYGVLLAVPASGDAAGSAFVADVLLFVSFAAHHSLFARGWAKRRLARVLPPGMERPVFVWTASLLLFAVCTAWQPLPGSLYRHTGLLWVLHLVVVVAGILLIALSVRQLDPLELAGIEAPQAPAAREGTGKPALVTSFPYSLVRHPIYLGWVMAVFGVPHMTWSRFLMACLSTAYLVVGARWEERGLARTFGPAYAAYCRRVRWRILPFVY
jgi:protein-S-isoprenylcysteine O-methyltransferase Ste14